MCHHPPSNVVKIYLRRSSLREKLDTNLIKFKKKHWWKFTSPVLSQRTFPSIIALERKAHLSRSAAENNGGLKLFSAADQYWGGDQLSVCGDRQIRRRAQDGIHQDLHRLDAS